MSEQTDKQERIAEQLKSSFGPTLSQIHTNAIALNTVKSSFSFIAIL